MIGRIAGVLLVKNAPDVLVDVAGVGYELQVPMSSYFNLPDVNQPVVLLTHLAIRDDAHVLYGFLSADERRVFKQLLKINGVGAKMALAILSGMNISEFISCVSNKDVTALTRIPGVGKKTAERLLVELADKLKLDDFSSIDSSLPMSAASSQTDDMDDAVNALESLGYKAAEVKRLLRNIDITDMPTEEIIRQALQQAMK